MMEWTDEESEKLCELYAFHTNAELLDVFPGRSYLSIYKKARNLGLKRDKKIETMNRKNAAKSGCESNWWNGGTSKTSKGYILIHKPEHHRANARGYVLEHILIWEEANKNTLPDGWIVHHINGKKTDNSPENLLAMPREMHTVLHCTGRMHDVSTKSKISGRAKIRLSNPRNHPMYKEIDIRTMQAKVASGRTVENVCKEYGINKTTYYRKIKEENNA